MSSFVALKLNCMGVLVIDKKSGCDDPHVKDSEEHLLLDDPFFVAKKYTLQLL